MLVMLLRVLLFVLIARVALEVWRVLGASGARSPRRHDPPAAPPGAGRKRPPLEGKIVDAEFEDLEERKRP
jgi:hypothetical protein